MANGDIGVKGWRNYSTFALFAGGSQRADRQTSMLVDTKSGNFSVLATDWLLAARIPCALARAYNHLDADPPPPTPPPFDRPFGPGWYWQFDMNLVGSMNGTGNVTWKAADGSEYEFLYSAGPVWASPPGLHDYTLTFDSGASPDRYILSVGRMNYIFEVAASDNRARLIRIEDLNGNALNIVRVYAMSEPTAQIDHIEIEYDNAGPAQHTIVEVTYRTATDLIERLRLSDTQSGSDYVDIFYDYANVDSALRLTLVQPQFALATLDMDVAYGYNGASGKGLELLSVADTLGIAGSYAWAVSYTGGQVDSVTFPIDSTPTVGTVAYDYAPSTPTGWSHGAPDTWTMVTDARGNDWYYGQNADGTVQFALDPLWVDTTHESYTEYTYTGELQVATVKTPRPNGESGQLETRYFYNANDKLAGVQDAYGFLSFYQYGTRTPYAGGGTGATTNDVVGVFTPMPNRQAYDDGDHTQSTTVPPTLSLPLDIANYVAWNTDHWEYIDDNMNPVELVLTRMDYTYLTGTGQLAQLLSCSPENFDEAGAGSHNPASMVTYALDGDSGCTCQVFGAITSGTVPTATISVTSGDLMRSYTPRQFLDADNSGYTAYTYEAIYGVVATVEGADSVEASAGKVTTLSYNPTFTRVTRTAMPEDNTDQWVETIYDERQFALSVQKPDIQSWGIDPIVSVTVYDDNGNTKEQWQALPSATPADWDGNTGGGGYEQVSSMDYDRVQRLTQSTLYVNWEQAMSPSAPQVSQFFYDKNGNREIARGPEYDAGGAVYDWTYAEFDATNRVEKVYNAFADASATPPGAAGPFTLNEYDLLGNVTKTYQPLYDWPNDPDPYYWTAFTYDWLSRGIETLAKYDDSGPTDRTTQQHFTASGGVYWTMDGEGFQLWPVADLNGRLFRMYRDNTSGDYDEREYDDDGQVLYSYTFQDVADAIYRNRSAYDTMGRLVNSGREEEVMGVWSNWNANTADTEFDYNGQVLKTYDKVNTGKFTERAYDDWRQLVTLSYPEVADPSGVGTVIYTEAYAYDVLGRRISAEDRNTNVTLFTFDLLGRTIMVEDALTFQTRTFFDARGLKWKTVTPRGAEYVSTYDARKLRTQLDVDHDSTVDTTQFFYDDNGRLEQTDYPDGGIAKLEYDALSRKTKSRQLLSGSDYLDTLYEYNLNDWLETRTLPGGYTVGYQYDDFGNVKIYTDTNGDATLYDYDLDNRNVRTAPPSKLVTINAYDWRTRRVSQVTNRIDGSSPSTDIVMQYAYDDNGQAITITDGTAHAWTKTYDAMGRQVFLLTTVGMSVLTWQQWYDGNGNVIATGDTFKNHYYEYDELNRMKGHGTTGSANDELYYWNCCNELSGYDDAISSSVATLTYDDLGRLTSHIDSAGSQVQYEYDELGRVVKLTPPQGAGWETEYTYNENGSLSQARINDNGTPADTDYGYDTTSGELLTRDFPVDSGQNIRTTYAYDSAGRLQYETITREGGGTTNLYRTQYAYNYLTYGNEVVRTEQVDSTGWVNSARLTYQNNAMGWQNNEEREEWTGAAWANRYTIAQTYDKNGNRKTFNKTVAGGFAGTYGADLGLTYTYDAAGRPTGVTDSVDALYAATYTCDANLNITQIVEQKFVVNPPIFQIMTTEHYFDVDGLNRVTANRVKYVDNMGATQWIKRSHVHSATGAILQSNYKTWPASGMEPAGNDLLHSWGQDGKHVQNTDTGGTTFGSIWHWAGSLNAGQTPLRSPNADTSTQTGYNLSAGGGAGTPQRMTFLDPTTQGDERNLWGQGMPNAKDSVPAWTTGQATAAVGFGPPNSMDSRIEFVGTVTATDLDRATDAREKGRVGIFGSGYSYYGSSPRVTSETIGRDINPLGRGDGNAYVGGMVNLGQIVPELPMNASLIGQGNSINNGGIQNDSLSPNCGCCEFKIGRLMDAGWSYPCDGLINKMSATCGKENQGLSGPICVNAESCLKAKCDVLDCVNKWTFFYSHSEPIGCNCASDKHITNVIQTNCNNCRFGSNYSKNPGILSTGRPIKPGAILNRSIDQGPIDPCRNTNPFGPVQQGPNQSYNVWLDRGLKKAKECFLAWKKQNPQKSLACLESYLFGYFGVASAYQYDGCCCDPSSGKEAGRCCTDGGGYKGIACGSDYGRHTKILLCPELFILGACGSQGGDLFCACYVAKTIIHEILHHCGVWHHSSPNNDHIALEVLQCCDCGQYSQILQGESSPD